MYFQLFPFFINTLLRQFEDQFEENPKPDYPYYFYNNGKDYDVSQENFEAYRKYFLQSIYWGLVSFSIAIVILVLIYIQAPSYPMNIMYIIYAMIGVFIYFNSVGTVMNGFYKPMDSEMWVTNLDQKFGKRVVLKFDSPAKVWWKGSKPVIQYLSMYFAALTIGQKWADGITVADYFIIIICALILTATIIWKAVEMLQLKKVKQKKQEALYHKREGEREWEAYKRDLDEKINPTKSKKKKKLKKEGKVNLKKYKGPTSNE